MSGRGPRGGRGVARGRGRGRGKTQIWEWESYTPGPEVYEQLWRVRKEPAIVTPRLPNDCPIPNARTRILSRRQTEDAIKRERYTVEITYTSEASSEREDLHTEVVDVDLRSILQMVSPAELERYETEQFRIEAEAEAIAMRTEAEYLARRQLQKNAKAPNTNKRSHMLSGLGRAVEPSARARGRSRAIRGRGQGRSRGLMLSFRQLTDDMDEELVDIEPTALKSPTENIRQPMQISPGVVRSAFVANSALSVSPVPQTFSTSYPQQEHSDLSELEDEEDVTLAGRAAKSITSATMQSCDLPAPTIEVEGEDDSKDYLYNRPRGMESISSFQLLPVTATIAPSTDEFLQAVSIVSPSSVRDSSPSATVSLTAVDVSQHKTPYSDGSPIAVSDSDDALPTQLPPLSHEINEDMNNEIIHMHTTHSDPQSLQHEDNDNADADGAEEYVVEAIIEHFQENGKMYYLVKWEGYEDSHDWLPEEDLDGAADLVAEYKERVGGKNKRVKIR